VRRGLPICGLLTAIALLTGKQVFGYQGEITPAPQGLRGPPLSIPDASPPAPSSVPTPVAGDQATLEIPIPEVFRGCWSGTVASLDSFARLSYWPPTGASLWFSKSYVVCFRQKGQEPWRLTFGDSGMPEDTAAIVDQWVRQIASSADWVELSAFLHFRNSLLFLAIDKQEWAELRCTVSPQGIMRVTAKLYAEANGHPWVTATWHADFMRASDANAPR